MSGVSSTQMLRGWFALPLVVCSLSSVWCEESTVSGDSEKPREIIFSDVTEDGLFFLNGKYVEAPYTVEATEATISVNGIAIEVESRSFRGGFHVGYGRGFRGHGWRGGSRNRGRFGDRGRSGDRPPSDETPGSPNRHARSEFRPGTGFRLQRTARRIAESLRADQFVVLFEQTDELILIPEGLEYDLCKTLLQTTPPTKRLQNLAGTGPAAPETDNLWREWLQTYAPPEQLVPLLAARYDKWQQVEENNYREIAAAQRLENYSYPLTLLGMLVGVISLGHLLRWPHKEDEVEAGSQTVRAVEFALWLMLGMAIIDLTWTFLATQAGVMKEVNPVAEKLVQTPLQLAIFKTFATGLGLTIFFLWRRRRQIQVATWWMCLVCVLVTFRWVIFDSAISP